MFAAQPPAVFWLSGVDLFSRGFMTGLAYFAAVCAFLIAYGACDG
jgi:hypothetical protein